MGHATAIKNPYIDFIAAINDISKLIGAYRSNREVLESPSSNIFSFNKKYEEHQKTAHERWKKKGAKGRFVFSYGGIPKLTYTTAALAKATLLFSSLEAFINLLLAIFLRPFFNHEIFLRKLGREELNLRLLYLPIHCDCFEDAFTGPNDTLFKVLQHCINARNNIIHGNIPRASQAKYGIPMFLTSFTFEIAEKIENIVNMVILRCVQHLKIELRESFLIAMLQKEPVYRKEPEPLASSHWTFFDLDEMEKDILTSGIPAKYLMQSSTDVGKKCRSFYEFVVEEY